MSFLMFTVIIVAGALIMCIGSWWLQRDIKRATPPKDDRMREMHPSRRWF